MTSVTDLYPHLIRRGHRRELLLLFFCVVCFLIGLVMVTPVSSRSGWLHVSVDLPVCLVLIIIMGFFFCFVWMFVSTAMQGGFYVFQIYDQFSCSGASLLLLSIVQSLAIGWIYGTNLYLSLSSFHLCPSCFYRASPLVLFCLLFKHSASFIYTFSPFSSMSEFNYLLLELISQDNRIPQSAKLENA